MELENLHDLVQKATEGRSKSKQSKVQIGYTVDTYNGVLEALKQITGTVVTNRSGSVFGTEYDGLSDIRFNENNFSQNTDACLWKMELGLFGSLPVKHSENGKYAIISVNGNDTTQLTQSGNNLQLPFILTNDLNQIGAENHFVSGAYIDITNALPAYMNQFYRTTRTNESFEFNADICQKLVENKCLVAQIIPKKGGGSSEVLIVGRAQVNNTSVIRINPTVFATSAMRDLGINITVSGDGNKTSILPSGAGDWKCAIEGESYHLENGTITKLTQTEFRTVWLAQSCQDTSDAPIISIDQLPAEDYYVKIYIPSSKEAIARKIFPPGLVLNEKLFQSYSVSRLGNAKIPASANADVRLMLQCIQDACNNAGCKMFTRQEIGTSPRGGQGHIFTEGTGHGTKWVLRNKNYTKAMAGSFSIPKGWPMCVINDNMNESANRIRGLPFNWNGGKWIKCAGGRMDSALNSISGKIKTGDMPREWYTERLNHAELGNIEIRCNSQIADQIQRFFNDTFALYAEAERLYSSLKGEQVTAGEIMLRCAPCLCAINGEIAIHRPRSAASSTSGHGAGCAIDFDAANNKNTDDVSKHFSTLIVQGMEIAYRPMLDSLYKNGGGWGGAYKFMTNSSRGGIREFDAMHIQF